MKSLFLLLLTISSFAHSQHDEVYFLQPAEDYFLLGMRQYAQADYKAALQSFQNSIVVSPESHRITASTIMLSKTHYALKDYIGASIICDSFLVNYPTSLYREDALFTKGMCYYNEGLYIAAFTEMQTVYSISVQRLNREHSFKVMDHIATEFLSEAEVGTLALSSTDPTVKALLQVVLAEKYNGAGDVEKAKELTEQFTDPTEGKTFQQRVNRLKSRIETGNSIPIGILLPLQRSSPAGDPRERKIAAEVLEGIQLALLRYEEHSEPDQMMIELDVQDSQRKSSVIDSIITRWSDDGKIVGIVGPIFSDETIEAASRSQADHIPILSPTATEEGISDIGNFVFQANSSISMRAKVLAQYAVNELGAKNIAILASNFASAKTQADSFSAEVQRLGATVVIDRRYQRGETDLRYYLREIRSYGSKIDPDYIVPLKGRMNLAEVSRRLVSYGLRSQTIDSLFARDGVINLKKLCPGSEKAAADSLKLPVQIVYPFADSLQYPVSSIDVIFCPISRSQQIGVITSQIAYFNLKTKILGTPDWYNINELELNRNSADGVLFGSDRWIEPDSRTAAVTSRYFQKFGKQITENVLFGYDAMSLMIEQIKNGSITREQLAESLSHVINYQGIRTTITFSKTRVNESLNILQYKDGSISKVQTYSYH